MSSFQWPSRTMIISKHSPPHMNCLHQYIICYSKGEAVSHTANIHSLLIMDWCSNFMVLNLSMLMAHLGLFIFFVCTALQHEELKFIIHVHQFLKLWHLLYKNIAKQKHSSLLLILITIFKMHILYNHSSLQSLTLQPRHNF